MPVRRAGCPATGRDTGRPVRRQKWHTLTERACEQRAREEGMALEAAFHEARKEAPHGPITLAAALANLKARKAAQARAA